MNQRKLIKLGNSSYAIALPKDWIDKSGLKKGDDVFITHNSNGELIVQATLNKSSLNKEKRIDVDKMEEEEIARNLISLYVSGANLLRFTGDKLKLNIVKKKAKNFLNLEPVEETEREVLFKDLLDIEDVGIENFIRRMDNNLKEMFNILLSSINNPKNSKEVVEELEEIDRDVTKFYFLIWRMTNIGIENPAVQTSLKISPSAFLKIFWISYNMEQIGDEIKRLARITPKVKEKQNIIEIAEILRDCYEKSMKSFFSEQKESSFEILSQNKEITRKIESLSCIPGLETVAEKFHGINANISRNAKLIFYNF